MADLWKSRVRPEMEYYCHIRVGVVQSSLSNFEKRLRGLTCDRLFSTLQLFSMSLFRCWTFIGAIFLSTINSILTTFSREPHLCEIYAWVEDSLITTILAFSSVCSTVIYPRYLHNLHFLPPLTSIKLPLSVNRLSWVALGPWVNNSVKLLEKYTRYIVDLFEMLFPSSVVTVVIFIMLVW